MLDRNSPEIAATIAADFGTRSHHETFLLELIPLQNAIGHVVENLARWIRPHRRQVGWISQPGKAWVEYQPLGVVGILAPWNYPCSVALLPVVDALAAGNRVLLKPSELTPRFTALLKRLMREAFAEEEVAVISGGPDVADRLCRLPLDHLLFTGSTAVGRRVMAAAAENLTPVTLELGGKSPALVCPDYPVTQAAQDIAYGKLANAGQTCIAPDYALVPESKAQAFAEAVIACAHKFYPSIASNPSYSSIINDRHYYRLRNAIEEARAGGADIRTHTDRSGGAERKIEPTVVLNAPPGCSLMTEEIFGPVLPIVGYKTIDDAIAYINARPKPLALYCMTHDAGYRKAVLSRTMSGGVTLNGVFIHNGQEDLPFGGIGPSGIGAYHGFAGFQRFSHARGIYQVRALNPLHWFHPPYGSIAKFVIRIFASRRAADSL